MNENVHEPDAELLDAEEAIQDAARLRMALRRSVRQRAVSVRVPLSALLEALDHLEPDELQQVVERVESRLAARRP